ncbi:MAG: DivIVA domain-containing protein [Thermodesulfobacteria bacterium]|nr:DivIVA domain-containing protein [Thermodesulfobacteriota bacterium]
MSITPNEILEKEFSVKLRGYNREEVNAFLEEVANYLATVIKERNELKDRVMVLKRQVAFLKQQEAEFRRALTAAHKAAEDMKASAKKKAELIIERAKLDGERIVQDAHKEAIELEDRIRRLRMLQRETVFKIRSSFEGFLRILDEEMALPPEDVDETLKIAAQEVRAIQGDGRDETDRASATPQSEDTQQGAKDSQQATSEGSEESPDINEIEEELADINKVERLKKEFGFEPNKLWPTE